MRTVCLLLLLAAGAAHAGPEDSAVLVRHYARGVIEGGRVT